MQIQIQGLLQFAVPLFPTAEVSQANTKLRRKRCSLTEPNYVWEAAFIFFFLYK